MGLFTGLIFCLTVTLAVVECKTFIECNGKPFGSYIPGRNGCRSYIYCGGERFSYEDSCPIGLSFNPVDGICDNPANVQCQDDIPSTTSRPSPTRTTTIGSTVPDRTSFGTASTPFDPTGRPTTTTPSTANTTSWVTATPSTANTTSWVTTTPSTANTTSWLTTTPSTANTTSWVTITPNTTSSGGSTIWLPTPPANATGSPPTRRTTHRSSPRPPKTTPQKTTTRPSTVPDRTTWPTTGGSQGQSTRPTTVPDRTTWPTTGGSQGQSTRPPTVPDRTTWPTTGGSQGQSTRPPTVPDRTTWPTPGGSQGQSTRPPTVPDRTTWPTTGGSQGQSTRPPTTPDRTSFGTASIDSSNTPPLFTNGPPGTYWPPTTQPAAVDLKELCVQHVSGYFAYPGDCRFYYRCSNGALVKQECQPGFGWDATAKMCTHSGCSN